MCRHSGEASSLLLVRIYQGLVILELLGLLMGDPGIIAMVEVLLLLGKGLLVTLEHRQRNVEDGVGGTVVGVYWYQARKEGGGSEVVEGVWGAAVGVCRVTGGGGAQ